MHGLVKVKIVGIDLSVKARSAKGTMAQLVVVIILFYCFLPEDKLKISVIEIKNPQVRSRKCQNMDMKPDG